MAQETAENDRRSRGFLEAFTQKVLSQRLEAWKHAGFWPRHRDRLIVESPGQRQFNGTVETAVALFDRCDPERIKALCALARKPSSLIVLVGPRGRGKTQLAALLALHQLVFGEQLPAESQPRARYRPWPEIVDAERGVFREEGGKGELADLYELDVLVLDEVQDPGTEFSVERLTRLVDRRYGFYRRTILVTSANQRELERVLGSSVTSRAAECGSVFNCEWEPYR